MLTSPTAATSQLRRAPWPEADRPKAYLPEVGYESDLAAMPDGFGSRRGLDAIGSFLARLELRRRSLAGWRENVLVRPGLRKASVLDQFTQFALL